MKAPHDYKSWPLHVKFVSPCKIDEVVSHMSQVQVEAFLEFAQFFEKEFLASVPRKTTTVVDLSEDDLDLLIAAGLLVHVPQEWLPYGLGMKLYSVPEVAKRRRRWIVHTVDINAFVDAPAVSFLPLNDLIEDGLQGGRCFTVDAAAYYHQFAIPADSQKYYSFMSVRGPLALSSIATGQRHSVGYAQNVSRFVLHRAIANVEGSSKDSKEAYIDNFRYRTLSEQRFGQAVDAFYEECSTFGIQINEEYDDVRNNIQNEYDFRGVHFSNKSVTNTSKTKDKLIQARHDISAQLDIRTAISIFGLCVFASTVAALPLAPYYYVYKYIRRRSQQISTGSRSPAGDACIWPAIVSTWQTWIDRLIVAVRLSTPQPESVIVSDASKSGWGAIWFHDGIISYVADVWTAQEQLWPICELEALAAYRGLLRMEVGPQPILLAIDNTTAKDALRNSRSRSFHLNAVVGSILAGWCVARIIWISTARNPSDVLSRGRLCDPESLRLHPLHQLASALGFGKDKK